MLLSLITDISFYTYQRKINLRINVFLLFMIGLSIFNNSVSAATLKPQQFGYNQIDQFLYVGDSFDVTFLQPTVVHKKLSIDEWADEFARIRQLGINELVIQWTRYDNVTFYPLKDKGDSLVNRIAEAAEKVGLDLYFGLAMNSNWAKPQNLDGKMIDQALHESKEAAKIVHSLLGKHPNFRGWYIPQELTDLFYTYEQQELLLVYFSELTAYLHKLDDLKPVLASGYTSPEKSHLVKFTMWWMHVFDESGIDILIFQDGAGTGNPKKWEQILPYVEAIAIIDDDYFSGDVWFVAEVFTQLDGPDINNKPFRAIPADFNRISMQLKLLGQLGKRLASYAYFPYMQPSAGVAADSLYQNYKEFINKRVTNNKAEALGSN
jgi:hypothetical protein